MERANSLVGTPVYKLMPESVQAGFGQSVQTEPATSPKAYKALNQMQMYDIIRRDSPNFSDWLDESGGFHYDEGQGKFVPDKKESLSDKLTRFLYGS